MKSMISRVGLVLGLTTLVAALAFAAPDKKKAPAAATCSACKMTLSAKKDKAHPTAVKVGSKTMYCCADCPMNKKKGKK